MNKIHYKIIYLCCLLTNSTDITSTEINIVDHLGITEENQKIITDIKPAEVIKDKIDIDMDFLIHSEIGFLSCLILFSVITFIVLIVQDNITKNYLNEYKQRTDVGFSFFLKLIIIPIISYIVIIVLNTNKYIKHNSLFKSWFIYMSILLIFIISTTKGLIDWKDPESDKTKTIPQDIYNIFNIFGDPGLEFVSHISPGIQGMRSIVATLFVNNLILITTYYTLKGYYHLRPMKYKEKRDYINSLKNVTNITPIQVLDNDLDKNLI
jgi:hypothetical protein